MSDNISIVFLGSGPVALRSLKLLSEQFTIEAIITKPVTTHEMQATLPGVPVHAVSSRRELDELLASRPFKSTLGVLIDFGIIVSQAAIDAFPYGIINSHFSLLPDLRGADPITFAILSGQPETGVSLMLLSAGMDEGPLLAQAPYHMQSGETTPSLTDILIDMSDAALKEIIPKYLDHAIDPAPQEAVTLAVSKAPTYSRKLKKDDGRIDWKKSATQIEREIRAFIQWPKSYTTLAGRDVVITLAHASDSQGEPGTVHVEGKRLLVACGEGSLEIDRLKPAGKPEMDASAFLAGYRQLL